MVGVSDKTTFKILHDYLAIGKMYVDNPHAYARTTAALCCRPFIKWASIFLISHPTAQTWARTVLKHEKSWRVYKSSHLMKSRSQLSRTFKVKTKKTSIMSTSPANVMKSKNNFFFI